MDVNIPLNAAAAAAVVMLAVAIGIMVKSATLLEKCRDALDELSGSVRDLRIATHGLRLEFTDGIRNEFHTPPPAPPAAAGPWPYTHPA